MDKIAIINQDHISGPQKIELPKLERISPHLKREGIVELKYVPDKEKKEYTKDEVEKAVNSTNKILNEERNMQYEFKVHEGTKRMMVKLIDKETKEVIKEIPPEKILDLIGDIWERLGILVDERG